MASGASHRVAVAAGRVPKEEEERGRRRTLKPRPPLLTPTQSRSERRKGAEEEQGHTTDPSLPIGLVRLH